MSLYAGFDLHSNSSHVAVLNDAGERIFWKKVPNDPETILVCLYPYQELIEGIAVESTYNWYWLVDTLMDEGYRLHLANPAAIHKYKGLKHSDDTSDAFWLAEMLRLGILPEGYIYPKADRPVRDLLRKRGHLVRLRSSLIISLQHIITRSCGSKLGVNKIKRVKTDWVSPLLQENEDIALSGQVSKETIDFLSSQIRKVENVIEGKVSLKPEYKRLLTMPGVGKILALTIMLETGTVDRFARVGDYSSYCRKVPTAWTSNGKKKGQGNKKNGNKYLAWAFSEVAELSRRYDDRIRTWYERKLSRTNRMIAHSSLAHKLVRAAFYVMRDEVPFDPVRCFA